MKKEMRNETFEEMRRSDALLPDGRFHDSLQQEK